MTEYKVTGRAHKTACRIAFLARGKKKRWLFSLQNVRTRKCSIVQEEEDEDDVSSCSGRDERGSNSALNSFNRRGSRSEGKLSHILQERLSQLPEKHTAVKSGQVQRHPSHQKEDTAVSDKSERLKHGISKNEKDNKTSSPARSKITGMVKADNVLLEKLPTSPRIISTCEENLKNRLSNTNTQPAGWSRKAPNTEARPKSVTECLKSTGPVPVNKWRMGAQHYRSSVPSTESSSTIPSKPSEVSTTTVITATTTTTTILLESSTVSIPLRPTGDNQFTLIPKYKTMPSPGGVPSSCPQITLNEILEDGDNMQTQSPVNSTECSDSTGKCRVVRRTTYEQRRSKFHKTRTTSCSSSDASDDDSESRKKRAHKLGASADKSLPPRRDSHDDSSDSQDPGGSGGGGGRGNVGVGNNEHTATDTPTTTETNQNNNNNNNNSNGTKTTGTTTTGGRHRCTENQVIFGRRHRAGRRRAGETRLRESQSLNRITEVQEAEAPSQSCHNHCHMSRNSAVLGTQQDVPSSSSSSSVSQNSTLSHDTAQPISQAATTVQKAKGLGARLLQSWSLGSNKSPISHNSNKQSAHNGKGGYGCQQRSSDYQIHANANDERHRDHRCANQAACNDKENRNASMNRNECNKSRKMRLLSRYFAVHKKLCVPLPGIFSKGRLYKARSCGSITRDRVSPPSPKSVLLCPAEDKWRERRQWCDAKQHRGSDGDINQNLGLAHLMQENIVGKGCAGLPTVCHIHLGDTSKCCSLC